MTSQGQVPAPEREEGARTDLTAAALLRAHYAFQVGFFITRLHESDSFIKVSSEASPSPLWNHAAWLGGSLLEFSALVDSFNSDRSGRRPVVYLDPCAHAEIDVLAAKGYERFEEEVWLVAPAPAQREISHRVREVSDPTLFREFCLAFSSVFGAQSHVADEALSAKSNVRHFVLLAQDKVVAIGTLIAEGRLGSLYNIGTLPEERNKGYAAELVRHILAVAASLGCDTLFLQVEGEGTAKRLYEKAGFKGQFIRLGYRLCDWGAGAHPSERPLLARIVGETNAGRGMRVRRETRLLPARFSLPLPAEFGPISIQEFFTAAWAYLLHRYTNSDVVRFRLQATHGRDAIIAFSPDDSVQGWIRSLLSNGAHGSNSTIADSGAVLKFLAESEPGYQEIAQGGLEVQVIGNPPRTLQICFREDWFSKDVVARMCLHFVRVLESMMGNPGGRVADLEILSESERHQLLVEWNRNDFHPASVTISRLFEEQVERTPDGLALMLAGAAAEQLSYRQLNRRANRLAHRLQEMGVRPGVAVAVLLDRSLEMIVALLGVFKAGGVWVPIDPALPAERLNFLLQDVEARVLVSSRRLSPFSALSRPTSVLFVDDGFNAFHKNDKNLSFSPAPSDPAYVIYTSGSTGQPKGVVVSHCALSNHALDCRKCYGLNPRDRILQFSSLSFDAALEQILPGLTIGGSLVVRDAEVWPCSRFDEIIREFQVTVADVPTPYWHSLVEHWAAGRKGEKSHSLRLMIVGGEAIAPAKLRLWENCGFKGVRLLNAYGPTEAVITATTAEITGGAQASSRVSIGRPRGDRKAYVLDSRARPVPIGVPGELHLGGTLLANGYHKQPRLTAARFLQNPFSDDPDARIYKTGDWVRYQDDGSLQFLGRLDDQVKVRGYRIELGEVEAVLRRHPAVREAVVLARPAEDGEVRLVAYVSGSPVTETDLKAFLELKLPSYMVPKRVVALKDWPLLPSGKIDRQSLPEPEPGVEREPLFGPRDPLELQLQLLFERVLRKAPVGIDQSFFALGGDSLQALELLLQIEQGTGKQLPLSTLYQASTVEALARELRMRVPPGEWSSLVPLQTGGSRPPLFLLHTTPGDVLGYGNLVYRLGPDQPCYGFQSLGLKDAHLSHTSVEEMARYYVDLLRQFQPHGPYYLGGWCYGGVVAVEMARLLAGQKETVGLLALLETVAMPARLSNSRYYLHRSACVLRMSPAGWVNYAREKVKFTRNARIANRMRFRQVNEGVLPRDSRLIQLEHVYNTNLAALNRYRSAYYPGTVTLFNAAERDRALIPDSHYGWVGLASQIRIHQVPGNHDSMLTEPNVSILAEQLNQALRAAQERKPSP